VSWTLGWISRYPSRIDLEEARTEVEEARTDFEEASRKNWRSLRASKTRRL
jgi:hypothetical protein